MSWHRSGRPSPPLHRRPTRQGFVSRRPDPRRILKPGPGWWSGPFGEFSGGDLSKVVMARALTASFEGIMDPVDVVLNLWKENPGSHVFLFEPTPGRILLGAAPETVATVSGGDFSGHGGGGIDSHGTTRLKSGRRWPPSCRTARRTDGNTTFAWTTWWPGWPRCRTTSKPSRSPTFLPFRPFSTSRRRSPPSSTQMKPSFRR